MRRLGRHLGAIALLALLVRAVMPAGYMIAAADTPHGRYLTVALCGDHQGQSQVIDLDTGKLIDASDVPGGTPKDKSSTHQPCVFASAPHFAVAATPVGPIVFQVVHQVHFAATANLRPGLGIAAPPPPSTGPPNLI